MTKSHKGVICCFGCTEVLNEGNWTGRFLEVLPLTLRGFISPTDCWEV